MMRMLLLGLWACAVMAGASYAAISMGLLQPGKEKSSHEDGKLETIKSRVISVPIINDGDIQGYVLAKFSVIAVSSRLKALPIKVDEFVTDEAFRAIYNSSRHDFRNMQKMDLTALSSEIIERVNKRIGPGVLKDLLIQEFSFISKKDARQ
jgi:hypothetical protein